MDKKGFLEYLKSLGVEAEAAEGQLCIADHLDLMLSARGFDKGSAAKAAESLIESLKESRQDSVDSILAVLRYGKFFGNDEVFSVAFSYLDGMEAMDGLYLRLGEVAGNAERDRIFSLIGEITPGAGFHEKARAMRAVMAETLASLKESALDELFETSFRTLPDRWYQGFAEELEALGADGFIEARREAFLGQLREAAGMGKPFFGQQVDKDVVALVEQNPEMSMGRREGGYVYVTKMPYRAKEWLAEKDEARRRYLYCHCPWARESILSEQGAVPAEFCRCSAGFHKKPWEVALGRQLECEVLESVLSGSNRCRFRVKIG